MLLYVSCVANVGCIFYFGKIFFGIITMPKVCILKNLPTRHEKTASSM